MRTTVNPGRFLQLEARLVLIPEDDGPAGVLERDTGDIVTLAGLLEQFRADPDDGMIGRVRITVEPAPW